MQHCAQMELIFFIFLHSSWFFEAELEHKDTYERFAEKKSPWNYKNQYIPKKTQNSPKKLKIFNVNEKLLVTNFCALEFESETIFLKLWWNKAL